MKFGLTKAKRERAYTEILLCGFAVLFVANPLLVTRCLDSSAALFSDIFFLGLIVLGLFLAVTADVMLAAGLVSCVYALLNFTGVKGIGSYLGYRTDDFMSWELAASAFLAAVLAYLVIEFIINLDDKGADAAADQQATRLMPKLLSKELWIVMSGCAAWVLSVGIVVVVLDPYGHEMTADDIKNMLLVMSVPSIALLALYRLYGQFVRQADRDVNQPLG